MAAALCLGLIACLGCWIPLVGLLTIPLSVIGLLLGGMGLLVDKKSSRSFATGGMAACLVALAIAIFVNGGLAVLTTWQADLAARREARAAAAEAQRQAEAAAAQNRASEQARQRAIALAKAEMASLQTVLDHETRSAQDAQKQFYQAQGDYDQFMAAQPLRTNAVYVKIKKDLTLRTGSIAGKQNNIVFLEQEINKPYAQQTWVQDYSGRYGTSGHLAGASPEEQAEQKRVYTKNLADSKAPRRDTDSQTGGLGPRRHGQCCF